MQSQCVPQLLRQLQLHGGQLPSLLSGVAAPPQALWCGRGFCRSLTSSSSCGSGASGVPPGSAATNDATIASAAGSSGSSSGGGGGSQGGPSESPQQPSPPAAAAPEGASAPYPTAHHPQHPQPPPKDGYSYAAHLTDYNSKAPLMSAKYPSSADDRSSVQKHWFTALFRQLNALANTKAVDGLKGRQRQVFEAVEADFEKQYEQYIRGKGLDDQSHRAVLMACLASATYRVLSFELGSETVVREIVRTNMGGVMVSVLMPLHRARLWLLMKLFKEDPFIIATNLLPLLRKDMGGVCDATVERPAPGLAALVVNKCCYQDVMGREGVPEVLGEFCCQHGLLWLNEFRRHKVGIALEQSLAWGDPCCVLRVSKDPGVTYIGTVAAQAEADAAAQGAVGGGGNSDGAGGTA